MGLDAFLRRQDGVLSRRQVLAVGLEDHDITRMLRRREWARLFPGVYVDHTGPPSWRQRAWAAALLHEPAALDAGSSLRASGITFDQATDDIELVVPFERRVDDPRGIRTRRTRAWGRITQLHLSPPRVRLETAVLVAASRAGGDDRAVALLGDVVQQRRTTAARLNNALAELTRLPRRRLLAEVLQDVSGGSVSALERRYLRDVERAHGLPRGRRQMSFRAEGTTYVHDVEYLRHGVTLELDGRLGHELWLDRWADLDRDLRTLLRGSVTLRAGWGQVLQPCRLADAVGGVLASRGWAGHPRPCGPRCLMTGSWRISAT